MPLRRALVPILVIPIVFPFTARILGAQEPLATREDAEWLDKCQRDRDSDEVRACEVLVDSVPRAAASIVVEASRNGAVEVRGWDRPTIEVHARIQSQGRTEQEARNRTRDVRLDLEPGRIRALGADDDATVSFEVLVPRRSGLEATTYNGPLQVSGLDSAMKLTTHNGPLGLVDLAGTVTARATNGPLHVTLVGDRWSGSGLDAETVNGPVHLEVPDGYSAELEAGTEHGPFSSDLPVTIGSGDYPRLVHMRLGGGGAPVRVVTTNGPVKIARR